MQKVLVITYYWPPAGGPGVQRWLKFTTYMHEFGLDPIVVVPKNTNYPIIDEVLTKEVHQELKIIELPIFEPYKIASLFAGKKSKRISKGVIQKRMKQSLSERVLLWIRGNFFIPDARKFWVKPTVRFLEKYVAEHSIKKVITTGPPHSVHLIGLGLQKQTKVQWIADFRDPWTTIGYHNKLKLSASSKKKHQQLEKQVLQAADKLIVTSITTRKEFEQKTQKPIRCITNGFDGGFVAKKLDSNFTISHIGTLLTDRNPNGLWQALQELVKENTAFAENLKIQLIGVVGEEVLASLREYNLEKYVDYLGYQPHEKILGYQFKSQVLLLAEIDSEKTKGIIPGKLFEYMMAKRPILALGPENWEAGTIVKATKSGSYLHTKDKSSIKAVVLSWFNQYQKGTLTSEPQGINKYHRRELTGNLVDYILWESS